VGARYNEAHCWVSSSRQAQHETYQGQGAHIQRPHCELLQHDSGTYSETAVYMYMVQLIVQAFLHGPEASCILAHPISCGCPMRLTCAAWLGRPAGLCIPSQTLESTPAALRCPLQLRRSPSRGNVPGMLAWWSSGAHLRGGVGALPQLQLGQHVGQLLDLEVVGDRDEARVPDLPGVALRGRCRLQRLGKRWCTRGAGQGTAPVGC